MQLELRRQLIAAGAEVGTEHPDGSGRFIDLVARHHVEVEFYEINSGIGPRLCIREALGQLLEYAYWGDIVRPARLFVVGDQPIDCEAAAYLQTLRHEFQLPLFYWHVDLPAN